MMLAASQTELRCRLCDTPLTRRFAYGAVPRFCAECRKRHRAERKLRAKRRKGGTRALTTDKPKQGITPFNVIYEVMSRYSGLTPQVYSGHHTETEARESLARLQEQRPGLRCWMERWSAKANAKTKDTGMRRW